MRRKYPSLDVVKMYATLTLEHWEDVMRKAVKSGRIEKLMGWRYGLQSGLADAVAKGISDEKMELWVIQRLRDIEQCAKFLVRKRNPKPVLDPKNNPEKHVQQALAAKRKRDREFEDFLMKSNF
jgi:hypothetical protein